ncbi:MAG: NAD-dependent epimerase/dehydratase family protein [Anaerolineales bacterium]
MKVLVLGATGFIGGHIAKAALAEGWQVSGFRRDPTFTGHLGESAAIKWITGDLNETDSLRGAMEGIEVLFHAAAYYPRRERTKTMAEHMAAAKREMETVLAAAKASGIRRVVYTSTLTAISLPPAGSNRIADERDVYRLGDFPESVYAETKALMEQMALAANDGLEVVVTNPTAVFGPGDVHLTLGGLLLLVAHGYAVIWLPALVNVIDVRDVAAAHILAAKVGKPGERYILGAHNFTVRETIGIVAKASGRRPPLLKFPLWLLGPVIWLSDLFPSIPLPANHLRGINRWQHYNTVKAEHDLGLQKRPFEETVLDALAWFKERGEL